MKGNAFLAFDLGATSGRAVYATLKDGKFEMREINRFPNSIYEFHGKYYWNIFSLFDSMKESLKICVKENLQIDSIGIDTWGVDFGYIGKDGTLLSLPRAYRDPYTDGIPEKLFKKIPRDEVYALTGIQIMNFNSLYQLYSARLEEFSPQKATDHILFMPDLLAFMLTGNKVWEYTDASTSQLLNPKTKAFEKKLFEAAEIPFEWVGKLTLPGTFTGYLTDEIQEETGVGKVPVITVAGHDTASAVAAVPATDHRFAYLSSGTWSLMGIETEQPIISDKSCLQNFTNEGGIEGTTRFLKNITGMWLLEGCRKDWCSEGRTYDYEIIVHLAEEAEPFRSLIDPDDPSFANPASMSKAIQEYCKKTNQPVPTEDREFIRCIFESLALKYKDVFSILEDFAPFSLECLHVIGGGSRNKIMNQFTANAIQKPVIAGPSEATAIGNCMMQAKAAGVVKDRWEMRKMISSFTVPDIYEPEDIEEWNKAYDKYKKVTRIK